MKYILSILLLFTFVQNSISQPCLEWAEPSPTTGWDFFQGFFGGAPCDDGNGCPFNQIPTSEVWQADAYEVFYVQQGVSYTFSHCDGPNAGAWVPDYTILTPDGSVDAYGPGDGDSCSITWTASQTGTYFILINEENNCGVSLQQDNGLPALTCNGVAPCPEILDLWIGPYAYPTASDIPGSCTGSISVVVNNGTPPYTFEFSTGQTGSSSELSELCSGQYWVGVTDSVGNSDTAEFVITNISNVFSNVLGVPGDTIFSTPVEECDLDYNLPIDSFEISGIITSGSDTVLVDWDIWQGGQVYSVFGYYQNLNNDSLIYSMVIFCEDGRAELGSFQLFSTFDGMNTGHHDVSDSQIHIVGDDAGRFYLTGITQPGTVTVIDMNGRVVDQEVISNGAKHHVDLSDKSKGIYVIGWMNHSGRSGSFKVFNP